MTSQLNFKLVCAYQCWLEIEHYWYILVALTSEFDSRTRVRCREVETACVATVYVVVETVVQHLDFVNVLIYVVDRIFA